MKRRLPRLRKPGKPPTDRSGIQIMRTRRKALIGGSRKYPLSMEQRHGQAGCQSIAEGQAEKAYRATSSTR
jgi:hypothetical protein